MQFGEVAHAFLEIEKEASRVKMTEYLAHLFKKATPEEARMIAYLSLGLLRAVYEGTQFNFAAKSLVPVVACLLDISEQEVVRRSVLAGDLGAVISEGTWNASDNLSLKSVFEQLRDFASMSGSGSVDEKMSVLVDLLRALDPLSARYIVRILLGKLRLGFSEMTLIDALSWMLAGDKSLRALLEYAFNVSADIGLIAQTAREGGVAAVERIGIVLGVPIRPAAAERLPSATAIIEKVGVAIAQPKFDGFRLQVHIDRRDGHTQITFFSRNLLPMTSMFPDLYKALKDLPVETAVIEGEALAVDEATGTYLPFQETVRRRRKYDIAAMVDELPLKLMLFDLLYLDGVSWLEKTQQERYVQLKKMFTDYGNRSVAVTDQIVVHTAQELEAYFLGSITAGLEGVMVKRPDSLYQPGKRNFSWIKLKRSERGKLDDTIDAVVLGYYNGEGKRALFGIGAFLVGVYNKNEDRFETIAKIGTGLTDFGWRELRAKCDELKITEQPHNVVVARDLAPDVWVTPELMVVIRADEITRSPIHSAGKRPDALGYALRFPRFLEYRFDKSPTEATDVEEITSLFEQQKMVESENALNIV
ncbi:MAG: putative DNA ligase [candidate division TM6 bacterium GW2011_GWE2_42_60]|nr:MAG: putative DNA ligase [candidate division TM6 bacterium GW2011_GWE2_42_60]HBY06031.1 DNA ligase [Candidatus Dependentiae bacterium]